MNIQELHAKFLESTGICTDTRKLKQGNLYLALKGDNFNGNAFAKAAIEQGASYAIVDEVEHHIANSFLVENGLDTLQALANFHRQYLNIPIIGLTGSNGKTTTKELINAVLSQSFATTATVGNLNNHIGVPLTLLSMTSETEIGIVEMGANHQGEIASLCEIAQPNYGYITNFGKAHLEGFGGIEGVIKGKSELYQYLKKSKGTALVNAQDTMQVLQAKSIKQHLFGPDRSEINVVLKSADPWVTLTHKTHTIVSQLIGSYNGSNIAAAIAFGLVFKIPISLIKKGIENYLPSNNRSQILKKNGNSIILDAYNANPTSMEAALKNLNLQTSNSRIVFLGDMYEVGTTTKQEHQKIANFIEESNIHEAYLVGESFYEVKIANPKIMLFSSFEHLKDSFQNLEKKENTILIKGSRGMAMERVLDLL